MQTSNRDKELENDSIVTRLSKRIFEIQKISEKLKSVSSLKERLESLRLHSQCRLFLEKTPLLLAYLKKSTPDIEYCFLSVIALGQGEIVFNGFSENSESLQSFKNLIDMLLSLESFYESIGGIIGYHLKVLELMRRDLLKEDGESNKVFGPPPFFDMRDETQEVLDLIICGLRSFSELGEMYAVGGAGDRLHLVDDLSKQSIPAAKLLFCGKTLLEGLVRDLEAREYLCYKLFGTQSCTPIVLMTSQEKNNDVQIEAICQKANWFGRPQESFFRVIQPLVPVITVDGDWAISSDHQVQDVAVDGQKLLLKPGGHGVIWKLAIDSGAFDWLEEQTRNFVLVRQINNPLAGIDYGLLAHLGFGYKNKKAFGFASCPRIPGVSEGVNALKKMETKDGCRCCITNVEYTELAKNQLFENKKQTFDANAFPANTNILFANLSSIKQAVKSLPIPGMLVNMKTAVQTMQQNRTVLLPGARLESTMQNIADAIVDSCKNGQKTEKTDSLKTFVTLNSRQKTISVTKKAYDEGKPIQETPEGAFYDLLCVNRALLQDRCDMRLPSMNSPNEYLEMGPSLLFLYNPALGPLYSVIAQKISGGDLASRSELQLEIAEISITVLFLQGSLLVKANRVVGLQENSVREFSENVGRVVLKNVRIQNRGIDRARTQKYWKNEIVRHEACSITLEGFSEFEAEDVTFEGNFDIRVPPNMKARAVMTKDGSLEILYEPLNVSWFWKYSLNAQNQIILKKENVPNRGV